METIKISDIQNSEVQTFSKKYNSPRGYITVDKDQLKAGDKVALKNTFYLIVE